MRIFCVVFAIAIGASCASRSLTIPPTVAFPGPPDPRLYRTIDPSVFFPRWCDEPREHPCAVDPPKLAEHFWAWAVDATSVAEYMYAHLARREASWIDVVASVQAQRDTYAEAYDDASAEPLIPVWAWVALSAAGALALGFVVGAQLGGQGVVVIDGGS